MIPDGILRRSTGGDFWGSIVRRNGTGTITSSLRNGTEFISGEQHQEIMAGDKVQSSVQEKVKACRNKRDRSQSRARLPSNWHGDLNQ
jgi:hypothetical protein